MRRSRIAARQAARLSLVSEPAARTAIDPAPAGPSRARQLELAADGALSVTQACEFLQVGKSKLYELMDDGTLAWCPVGRNRKVLKRSAIELLASRMNAAK